MAGNNPSSVALLTELPGLEAAKQAIDARIAEIKRLVYGEDQTGQIESRPIRRRTITEETREQRRQFLAKARAAKIERLHAQKKDAPLTPAGSESTTTLQPNHPAQFGQLPAKRVDNAPAPKNLRKRN